MKLLHHPGVLTDVPATLEPISGSTSHPESIDCCHGDQTGLLNHARLVCTTDTACHHLSSSTGMCCVHIVGRFWDRAVIVQPACLAMHDG